MNDKLSHDHNWTTEEIEDLRVRFLESSDEEAASLWVSIADSNGGSSSETQLKNVGAVWTPEVGAKVVRWAANKEVSNIQEWPEPWHDGIKSGYWTGPGWYIFGLTTTEVSHGPYKTEKAAQSALAGSE